MPQRQDALVIAIDGPSGSGKSTVARAVATRLGLRYLDTGAMYRAVTWAALDAGLPLTDGDRLTELAASVDLTVSTDPTEPAVHVAGTDVTRAIRGQDVSSAVSAVSAVPGVRGEMVRRQRSLIGSGGIVVEGRDIGTTVLPEAPVKIFLTADDAVRAARRGREIGGNQVDADLLSATREALRRRDAADSGRAASPLAQAPDAVVLDSTGLDVDAVVAKVLELAQGKAVS